MGSGFPFLRTRNPLRIIPNGTLILPYTSLCRYLINLSWITSDSGFLGTRNADGFAFLEPGTRLKTIPNDVFFIRIYVNIFGVSISRKLMRVLGFLGTRTLVRSPFLGTGTLTGFRVLRNPGTHMDSS